jgi:thymidylate synthase
MSLLIAANWQTTCYARPWYAGIEVSPRGRLVREILNFDHKFYPEHRLINHVFMPLNMEYLKAELRWYVAADYDDESIAAHASTWDAVRNPDGRWLSNYGYWLWGEPQRLRWVIDELKRDPESRRAVVHISTPEHLHPDFKDIACTMYMNFHIRTELLYTSVRMRSQDAVWGLRNDLPFFWFVADVVSKAIGVPLGYMHYVVDSYHIYEQHFEKIKTVVSDADGWIPTKLNWAPLVDKVLYERLSISPKTQSNAVDSGSVVGTLNLPEA